MTVTDEIKHYAEDYKRMTRQGWDSINTEMLQTAANLLEEAYLTGRRIYTFGNGGSASIANHFLCDHQKGIGTGTPILAKVVSLVANIEILTAISNDMSYDEIFSYQLAALAEPGDVVFTISSSGNSENVIRAIKWALEHDVKVIGLTGFTGGRLRELATVSIHAAVNNYGVVEDIHQGVMHVLAQFLRRKHMDPAAIGDAVF